MSFGSEDKICTIRLWNSIREKQTLRLDRQDNFKTKIGQNFSEKDSKKDQT